MSVSDPPTDSANMTQDVYAEKGKELWLDCFADANPLVNEYLWTKMGTQLSDGHDPKYYIPYANVSMIL